jgi:hypothetical protein
MSDYKTSNEVRVEEFFVVNWYKELCRPFLGYFFHVLLYEFVIGLELFFVFISTCSDIDEVSVCMKIHEWIEPVQSVCHHAMERFNGPLQLQIIGVEHRV